MIAAAVLVVLVLLVLAVTTTSCVYCEGFEEGTVLDWLRRGVRGLGRVPDLLHTHEISVAEVDVTRSTVWLTMMETATDGVFVYDTATSNRLQLMVNARHPFAQFFARYDAKLADIGIQSMFPTFSDLSSGVLTFDVSANTVTFDDTFAEAGNDIVMRSLYTLLLYVSIAKFCDENPVLVEEVLKLEVRLRDMLSSVQADRKGQESRLAELRKVTERKLRDSLKARRESSVRAIDQKSADATAGAQTVASQKRGVIADRVALENAQRRLTNANDRNDALVTKNAAMRVNVEKYNDTVETMDLPNALEEAREKKRRLERLRGVRGGQLRKDLSALRGLKEQRGELSDTKSAAATANASLRRDISSDIEATAKDNKRYIAWHERVSKDGVRASTLDAQYAADSARTDRLQEEIRRHKEETVTLAQEIRRNKDDKTRLTLENAGARKKLSASRTAEEQKQDTHAERTKYLERLRAAKGLQDRLSQETRTNVALKDRWRTANKTVSRTIELEDKMANMQDNVDNAVNTARLDERSKCPKVPEAPPPEPQWVDYRKTAFDNGQRLGGTLDKGHKAARNIDACKERAKQAGYTAMTYNHRDKKCYGFTQVDMSLVGNGKDRHNSAVLK